MTTSTSALDRTPRRTIRDLLPVLGTPKAARALLLQQLGLLLLGQGRVIIFHTYATSIREDGDECSRNAAARSPTSSPARRASGSSRRTLPSGAGPPPTNRSADRSRPACVEIKFRTPSTERRPLDCVSSTASRFYAIDAKSSTPSTRRRPVTASARWRGGSTPSTRRRPLNCGSSTA